MHTRSTPASSGPGGGQHQDVPKGRLVPQAAQLDFLLIEAVIVLAGGETDDVVVRGVGLDHRSPPLLPAAGPAHHLGDQREGALPGAEVGGIEGHICVHHPHQGHIVKVQPFGHHLGPNQDGDALFLKSG